MRADNKKKLTYSNSLELKNKTILVTGGTGSFGGALVNVLLKKYEVKKLIIFSRDEFKQYEMENELKNNGFKNYRFFIGDVRDVERLKLAFKEIDIVIHAAALKHVPSSEYNPFECVNTNIIGAQNVITASIYAGVSKVIALSTDKAVNPVNLYGASKLASDKIFISANQLSGKDGCEFSVVRYGNVLGSRGSVVNIFEKLIKEQSSFLPITDVRMTRFWITLDQGVDFVLSSLDQMIGGEIFVPKIPSMKIIDLAKTIAPKLKLKLIGIRPGEKIHEILITEDDSRNTFYTGDRYIIKPMFIESEKFVDSFKRKNKKIKLKKVTPDFYYSSDINKEYLDSEQLIKLINRK